MKTITLKIAFAILLMLLVQMLSEDKTEKIILIIATAAPIIAYELSKVISFGITRRFSVIVHPKCKVVVSAKKCLFVECGEYPTVSVEVLFEDTTGILTSCAYILENTGDKPVSMPFVYSKGSVNVFNGFKVSP
jgi:hypothetical protein